MRYGGKAAVPSRTAHAQSDALLLQKPIQPRAPSASVNPLTRLPAGARTPPPSAQQQQPQATAAAAAAAGATAAKVETAAAPPVAVPSGPPAAKQGTLRKQGGSWKSWKERVCILDRNEIKYFEPDDVCPLTPALPMWIGS